MVGKGHQVGAEPICLETLREEDIIPEEGGKVVYSQPTLVSLTSR